MAPRYEKGQKVAIKPVDGQPSSLRDSALNTYAGQTGVVIDYYWISPPSGEVFYIYSVRIEADGKEIALYEDEIDTYFE